MTARGNTQPSDDAVPHPHAEEPARPLAPVASLDVADAARTRAEQHHAAGDTASACDELVRAAGVATATGDILAAARDLERAAGMAETLPALQRSLLLQRASLGSDHDLDATNLWWDTYLAACVRDGDRDGEAHACYRAAAWGGADVDARALLERGAALDDGVSCWALCCRSMLLVIDGAYADAAKIDTQVLELARSQHNQELELHALEALAYALSWNSEPSETLGIMRQTLALAKLRNDHRTVVKSFANSIELHIEDTAPLKALAVADEFDAWISSNRLAGYRYLQLNKQAAALLRVGRVRDALERATESYELMRERPVDILSSLMALTLVQAQLDAGTPFDVVDATLAHARALLDDVPCSSFEIDAQLLACRRQALIPGCDFTGVPLYTDDAPVAEEPTTLALHGLALARTAVLSDNASLIEHLIPIIELIEPSSPLARAGRAEIEALVSPHSDVTARIAQLDGVIETWISIDAECDAALARAARACLVAASPQGAVNSSIVRDARDHLRQAHATLTRLGAFGWSELVARHLPAADRRSSRAGDALLRNATSEHGLFAGLSSTELLHVGAQLATRSVTRGTVLHTADDDMDAPATRAAAGDMIYIIRHGRVRVTRQTADGKSLTVAVLGDGDICGTSSLAAEQTSRVTTSSTMIDDGAVSAISAARLRALMQEIPTLAINVVTLVGHRLEMSEQLAQRIAYAPVDARFAHLMLDLDQRFGHPTMAGARVINLPFTQTELAEMIGATRKAVATLVARLRADNVIELSRKRIVIHDRAVLQQLASTDPG